MAGLSAFGGWAEARIKTEIARYFKGYLANGFAEVKGSQGKAIRCVVYGDGGMCELRKRVFL